MEVRNFATFGLFSKGEFMESGTIPELHLKAIELLSESGNEENYYTISTMEFDSMPYITESTKVLSYSLVKGKIYVINQL